ncbi:MAG: response regulator [Fusobacteria bacterium]|nr:response regulator [Fusobacteriota bacterium]
MKYKVLIVDDEENIRGLLKNLIDDFSEVFEADTGKKGFSIFEKESPDLILLDIMLPDTSGVELLQQIRNKDRKVKIVMITAYETIKSVIDIMDIKISGYITKPFVIKEVREKLQSILEN